MDVDFNQVPTLLPGGLRLLSLHTRPDLVVRNEFILPFSRGVELTLIRVIYLTKTEPEM